MKRMTYAELLGRLASMTPEQLSQPVIWLGDERGGVVGDVEVLTEEHVNFGEGIEPWSSYKGGEYEKSDACATYPAGTVFLLSDVPESASATFAICDGSADAPV